MMSNPEQPVSTDVQLFTVHGFKSETQLSVNDINIYNSSSLCHMCDYCRVNLQYQKLSIKLTTNLGSVQCS